MNNEETKKSWLESHISLHTHDDAKAERANFLTHAFGSALSVIALIIILVKNQGTSSTHLKIGMVVYALTMILLYSASALYHKLPVSDGKRFCRILDHSNIYFLIAGTYTPIFCYVNTPLSLRLTILMWSVAAGGVLFTLVFWGKLKPLHVIFYLAMGWMVSFFWKDLVPFLPPGLFKFIVIGGVTYTLGVIFYACKRIPHYHAIWHLFCIGGSLSFFLGFVFLMY
ncbi:MAG: hemolysin III family protein [Sphaerochaetaceae bacterium]